MIQKTVSLVLTPVFNTLLFWLIWNHVGNTTLHLAFVPVMWTTVLMASIGWMIQLGMFAGKHAVKP